MAEATLGNRIRDSHIYSPAATAADNVIPYRSASEQ
jgi:hypothetical protein